MITGSHLMTVTAEVYRPDKPIFIVKVEETTREKAIEQLQKDVQRAMEYKAVYHQNGDIEFFMRHNTAIIRGRYVATPPVSYL